MKFIKTIGPAIVIGLAVASSANAQVFGTVETGGAFGVGGGVPVATAAAPVGAGAGAATGFVTGLGALGAAGPLALGLGAIVAVGAVSSGNSTSGTN